MSTPSKTKKPAMPRRKKGPQELVSSMKFKREHRCFKRGRTVTFRPGVNLLVGDQGCGKSTILGLLSGLGRAAKGPAPLLSLREDDVRSIVEVAHGTCGIVAFDFEKESPRTLSYLLESPGGMAMQLNSKFMSHGQTVNTLLEGFGRTIAERKTPMLVLLDEPDMALSPRSAYRLAQQLEEIAQSGCQVIASVHNPIVISSQPQVLSLEHKKWMSPDAFLASHESTPQAEPAKLPGKVSRPKLPSARPAAEKPARKPAPRKRTNAGR